VVPDVQIDLNGSIPEKLKYQIRKQTMRKDDEHRVMVKFHTKFGLVRNQFATWRTFLFWKNICFAKYSRL